MSQVGALHALNMKQMGECPGCDPPTARILADGNRSIVDVELVLWVRGEQGLTRCAGIALS